MIGRRVYKIWAPIDIKWSRWVRPVPFVQLDNVIYKNNFKFEIPKISYISSYMKDTAIIVDLPSSDGVEEGIALSKIGYIPIPLYNGTNEQQGSMSILDNSTLELSLVWGAQKLKDVAFLDDVAPAFLLDSDRMNRLKVSLSVYDNSWDVYSQDMPSSKFLLQNGINKIIIRSDKIRKDVQKILYEYSQNGIGILYTNGYTSPRSINIKKVKGREID